MDQWEGMSVDDLKAAAKHMPGVSITTGNRCRAMAPAGPEVHNLHMSECTGLLLNHDGPHSWERP